MAADGSVTYWIGQLKAGDPEAAQKLWEGYFQRVVRVARQRLRHHPRRAADEEDVALSAFDSFCQGAVRGRFPLLSDRDSLWQLLITITDRKAIDLIHHEHRRKRGGGLVHNESAFDVVDGSSGRARGFDGLADSGPTPEFAAQLAEEFERLFERLGDESLRAVALWKMQGYSNHEIADKLGCAPRTVERKLRTIRILWSQEFPP